MRGRCDYEKSKNWQQERTLPHKACFDDGERVMHESRKVGGLLETGKGNGSPVGAPEITTVLAAS